MWYLIKMLFAMLFKRNLNLTNIRNCVYFTRNMKRYILSVERLCVLSGCGGIRYFDPPYHYDFVCIDYGLIFSVSNKIKRYVVTENGCTIMLEDSETVIPLDVTKREKITQFVW